MNNSKFTEIDEEFICENCGKKVPELGYSCRNHCPYCLHSKHLDINPGDRAEDCCGILEPIGIEINSKNNDEENDFGNSKETVMALFSFSALFI